MRRPKEYPPKKIQRPIEVTPDLRRKMQELFRQVDGWDDMPFEDEQDDSIQVTGLSGNRVRDTRRPIRITYIPPGTDRGTKWKLALHQPEIEDIGYGMITELNLYCCSDPECGFRSTLSDMTCSRCDWEDE